ncbi:MAG: deoxynucleoside kinase [Proteobacteria bacterium]|nr:deoxynucleoside kinase [Pseudomonadota bacterium]
MGSRLRIAVEGNIGVGKSTLLPRLQEALPGDWEILSERVDEDPEFKKRLEDFYNDPNKQAQLQAWISPPPPKTTFLSAPSSARSCFATPILSAMKNPMGLS